MSSGGDVIVANGAYLSRLDVRCCSGCESVQAVCQMISDVGDADVLLCAAAIKDELSRLKDEAFSCCLARPKAQDNTIIVENRSTSPEPDEGWVDLATELRGDVSIQPGRTRKLASRSS